MEFFTNYWTYLTIPVVSAIVGFGTNWLAVKMMLWPIDFKGIGPVGWQGVVPANAEKMATTLVDTSIRKVLPQQELMDRIDPQELLEAIKHRLDPLIEEIVDEAMEKTPNYRLSISSFVWLASPTWMKKRVYSEVRAQLPDVIDSVVAEMKDNLDSIVDVNEMVIEKIVQRKEILSEIFIAVAGKEFAFISKGGLYFGFPLGIPAMFLWYYYPSWWLLPTLGLLVGYLTNKLALYMVQKPLNPVKIGPFTLQGLFIKRQKEVSTEYAKVFANELITGENILTSVMREGESSNRLFSLIEREVNQAIEASQGNAKPLVAVAVGTKGYYSMRERVCDRVFTEMHRPDQRSFEYIDNALQIEDTLAERVGALPPKDFFGLLHPAIAEDEWKLILTGAVLGFAAGLGQWVLLT